MIKTIPKKKKCIKTKWLSEEALQIAVKRREVKGKREKERYTHLNAEFQITARRDKKVFLSEGCKEAEEDRGSRSVVSDSLRPVDCIPPSSSVHRILQARTLEWVAISFSNA